jgi:hypothetical protein
MSTFADVAAFAARHAACGGLVPRVHAPRDGGHMLTVTCACGAVHERWVTADEARELPGQDARSSGREPSSSEPSYELLLLDPDRAGREPEAAPPPAPTPVTRPLRPQPATARPATIFRPPANRAAQTAAAITHPTKPRGWLATALHALRRLLAGR